MIRIEISETGSGPRPVYVAVDDEVDVARTKQIVPTELMVDLDAGGRLLGIEILTPALLVRVPDLLRSYGLPVPETFRFDKLVEALSAAAPAA